MIWALLIFVATLIAKLAVDVRLYLRGGVNKHRVGPAIVLVALVACSWLAGWTSTGMWFFGWWILFDGLYNKLIGQDWFFVGETAKLDKLQRKYPFLVILKYSLFAASIAFYFITR